jgi:putative ABC transport system permease protein
MMRIEWSMAWRNLWRHRRRTWLTASAIAFVTLLLVFVITLQLGSYDMIVDSSLRIYTGQLQVQHRGYLDKPQMRHTISDATRLANELREILPATAIAVRAQGFALASSQTRSYGVMVVGVEPKQEARVSTIPRLMTLGGYLTSREGSEAVVGAILARNLNIKLGQELTLLGSAYDGSVAAIIVTVKGIFESGMEEIDRQFIQLPLKTFQDTFHLESRAHALSIVTEDIKQLDQLMAKLQPKIEAYPQLALRHWEELLPGMKQLIDADWTTAWFTYIALILVVTFSIMNTFIMSVLERTREFGVMLALGATPLRLGWVLALESFYLTLIGLTIGIAIGTAISTYFTITGFTFESMRQLYGQFGLSGIIHPKLTPGAILLGPAVVLCFMLLASLYPSLRIRRLHPVEAMQAI